MYVIIIEHSLSDEHDNDIAFISVKEVGVPGTPISGQYSADNECYYEWYKTYEDYQVALDVKNELVDRFKPYMMVKKNKKNHKNVTKVVTSE
mgnify:CR=1 FL=1